MESDEVQEEVQEEAIEPRRRGFWLTAFLILMFISNPLTAYLYFSDPGLVTDLYPNANDVLVYTLALLALANTAFAAGIWAWKKWGVFGFYGSVVLAFCLNLYIGLGLVGSLFGLIGAVIIYSTTRARWEHFS